MELAVAAVPRPVAWRAASYFTQLDKDYCDGTRPSLSAGEPPDRKKPMPPRHRFLEPIHNVKERGEPLTSAGRTLRRSGLHLWKNSEARGPPSLKLRRAAFALLSSGWLASRSRAAAKAGGASRDRTGDLKLAKLALSQLSYGPSFARHRRASAGKPAELS